jgi:hypothetical protein
MVRFLQFELYNGGPGRNGNEEFFCMVFHKSMDPKTGKVRYGFDKIGALVHTFSQSKPTGAKLSPFLARARIEACVRVPLAVVGLRLAVFAVRLGFQHADSILKSRESSGIEGGRKSLKGLGKVPACRLGIGR